MHSGSVAVFFYTAENFSVESLCLHGPNVVSFQLVSSGQRWYIVELYLAPDDALTIEVVISAIRQRPCGVTLLVAGDCNANLAAPEGNVQEKDIATALSMWFLRTLLGTSSHGASCG